MADASCSAMAPPIQSIASRLLARITRHELTLGSVLALSTMTGPAFGQEPDNPAKTDTEIPPDDSGDPLPATSIVLLGTQFPLAGLVLGQLPISREPGDLIFENAIGEPVEGSLEKVSDTLGEGTFAWRPDESLVKGQYTAHLPGEAKVLFHLVSGEGTLPEVVHKLDQFRTGLGAPIHCEKYAEKSSNSIIFESFRVDAIIDVWIQGKLAPQYMFWIRREDGPLEEISDMYHRLILEPGSNEVCFEVFFQHALDLEPTTLESACVDASVLSDVGVFDEPYGELASVLGACTEPPLSFESEWCEHFKKAFSANDCAGFNDSACIAAFKGCGEGSPPKDALRRVEENTQVESQPSIANNEAIEAESLGYPHCSLSNRSVSGNDKSRAVHVPLLALSLLFFIRRRRPHVAQAH